MTNAEAVRRYRERHPVRVREALYSWRDRNRRKMRVMSLARSDRYRGIPPGWVEERMRIQGGKCAYCPNRIARVRGGWRRGPGLLLVCLGCWWLTRDDGEPAVLLERPACDHCEQPRSRSDRMREWRLRRATFACRHCGEAVPIRPRAKVERLYRAGILVPTAA